MGTVFLKNTTSSPITVAGHKVYYIDSTDAEIVEVEKQGGGGSATSDDATGTISGVTLPTAHSYTGVSFDSLRYYVKGTLSNIGSVYGAYGYAGTVYYGTVTWTDETLGDLTDKITVTDPQYNYRAKQTVFRIIFISSDVILGYHPWDDNDNGEQPEQISSYSYNNGVHSITFYATSSWYGLEPEYGCIQFRYLDGTTTFQNLSAFDLVSVSSGTLSKVTSTNRYKMYNAWGGNITLHALYGSGETIRRNAFKYLLSGTPYWYVIDGEHDTWTDDLSEWGYSEVQPVVELPEVSVLNNLGVTTSGSDTPQTVASGGTSYNLKYWSGGGWYGSYEPFDNTKCYAIVKYGKESGVWLSPCGVFEPVDASGNISVKNVSQTSQVFRSAQIATCSDSTATVVTVYNSSNTAYNAFKFTSNNTDYYYVLDGTQTDWTDDLSSIGYHIPLPTVTLDAGWCSITPNHIWFSSGDTRQAVYWRGYWSSWFYDSSKAYAAWWWRSESESAYYGTVLSDNGDGYFGITNVLGRGISSYIESHYATCDSPDATAVPVYNSSNVAYTAFKYTRGSVDYYYVLDEVQTDWTDDLSSIGYHV